MAAARNMGMHRVAHRVSARTAATIAFYRSIEGGVDAPRSPLASPLTGDLGR